MGVDDTSPENISNKRSRSDANQGDQSEIDEHAIKEEVPLSNLLLTRRLRY